MRQFLTSICVLAALAVAGGGSKDNNDTPIGAVVGVRPGMSRNEAATFVMCDNPMMVVAELHPWRGPSFSTPKPGI